MTDRKREMASTICIFERTRPGRTFILKPGSFESLPSVAMLRRPRHSSNASFSHDMNKKSPFLSLWHDSVRAGQTFPAAFPGQVWPTSQGWRNGQFVQPYRTPKRIRTYQLASKIPSQSGSLLEASISNWDYTNENEEEKLTVRAYFYVLVTRATLESQDHRDTYMQVHQPQVYKVTLPWRIPPERCVSRTRRTQSYHSGHHRT